MQLCTMFQKQEMTQIWIGETTLRNMFVVKFRLISYETSQM